MKDIRLFNTIEELEELTGLKKEDVLNQFCIDSNDSFYGGIQVKREDVLSGTSGEYRRAGEWASEELDYEPKESFIEERIMEAMDNLWYCYDIIFYNGCFYYIVKSL